MDRRVAVPLALLVAVALVAGAVALGVVGDDETWATVRIVDENGTEKATVQVRVADTFEERYTGLSDTDLLADGEGMLFVHDSEATQTYVMRDMDFPLDIIFVAADGTITTIHHAPVPEQTPEDDLRSYRGRAKYVLEVPSGFANATGIEVGDRVVIPAEYRNGEA